MLAIGEIYRVNFSFVTLPAGYAARNFRFGIGTNVTVNFGPAEYSGGVWTIAVPSDKTLLITPGYISYGVWCVDADAQGLLASGKILVKNVPGRLTV